MGYNLYIGEAVIEWDDDGITVDVEPVELPEAPAFGEPTDHTNGRWPSYSGWAQSCRELDIVDAVMNTQNGGEGSFTHNGVERYPLMQSHPGHARIHPEHLAYIEERVEAYRKRNPGKTAGFPQDDEGNPKPNAATLDPWLVRGEWLVFWLRWALENCKRPVFTNS